jgi:hypothetical protein
MGSFRVPERSAAATRSDRPDDFAGLFPARASACELLTGKTGNARIRRGDFMEKALRSPWTIAIIIYSMFISFALFAR